MKGKQMSKTPRTDEIIRAFVSGENEAACIICLRRDVEELEMGLEQARRALISARNIISEGSVDLAASLLEPAGVLNEINAALAAIESEATDGK